MPKTTMQALQERLDKMEATILKKAQELSGFGGENSCARTLTNLFKFYDKTDSGFIFYPHFKDAMLRFNIMGGQMDSEELFSRYDEDLSGCVDYRYMAYEICDMGIYHRLNKKQVELLEDMRYCLASKGGHGFVNFCRQAYDLYRKSANEAGLVYLDDVMSALGSHFSSRLNRGEIVNLLCHFSYHDKYQVDLLAILRALKSGMSLYRKKLVRAVFDKLDPLNSGHVSCSAICSHFNSPCLPSSPASPPLDWSGMLSFFQSSSALFSPPHPAAQIQWPEIGWASFLDYYRCLSLVWDSDRDFEEVLRTSWHIPEPCPMEGARESGGGGFTPTRSMSSGSVPGGGLYLSSLPSPGSSMTRAQDSPERGKATGDVSVAASPVMRRVLVERRDGTEEVVDLLDDWGRPPVDKFRVTEELATRGLTDVTAIKFY